MKSESVKNTLSLPPLSSPNNRSPVGSPSLSPTRLSPRCSRRPSQLSSVSEDTSDPPSPVGILKKPHCICPDSNPKHKFQRAAFEILTRIALGDDDPGNDGRTRSGSTTAINQTSETTLVQSGRPRSATMPSLSSRSARGAQVRFNLPEEVFDHKINKRSPPGPRSRQQSPSRAGSSTPSQEHLPHLLGRRSSSISSVEQRKSSLKSHSHSTTSVTIQPLNLECGSLGNEHLVWNKRRPSLTSVLGLMAFKKIYMAKLMSSAGGRKKVTQQDTPTTTSSQQEEETKNTEEQETKEEVKVNSGRFFSMLSVEARRAILDEYQELTDDRDQASTDGAEIPISASALESEATAANDEEHRQQALEEAQILEKQLAVKLERALERLDARRAAAGHPVTSSQQASHSASRR